MSQRSLTLAFLCSAVVIGSAWWMLNPTRAADDDKAELDMQVKSLLEQRRDTLQERLDHILARESRESSRFHDRILAKDDLLQAQIALATSHEGRIAIAKDRVKNLREREDFVATQVATGVGDMGLELAARAARLQAEIDLVHEQQAAK